MTDDELDILTTKVTLPMSHVYASPSYTSGTITVGANGTSASSFYGTTNYQFNSNSITSSNASKQIHVSGDAVIEGQLKVGGVDIAEAIEKINKRLAILVPDPAKLEKFEALQRAYENYKTLEALCQLPDKDD